MNFRNKYSAETLAQALGRVRVSDTQTYPPTALVLLCLWMQQHRILAKYEVYKQRRHSEDMPVRMHEQDSQIILAVQQSYGYCKHGH